MRVILLVLVLVMAPTAAFFLWAWAVKIKQERKLAGTLPAWQDMPITWLAIAGLLCTIAGFLVHVLHPEPGLRRSVRAMMNVTCRHDDRAVCRACDGRDAADANRLFAGAWTRRAASLRASSAAACATRCSGRPVERHRHRRRQAARDGDARARGGGSQGRADRPQARHGDGDRQRQAVRAHDPAARRRDRRPPRRRGLHRRLADDAGRRDFTFNALYADPDGTIYDPFDGRADLAAGRVRFIGDPDQRIAEDRLRVLRFFRFHAWYGKPPLDGAGFEACRRNAGALGSLSAERVPRSCCACWRHRRPPMRWRRWREAGALDHWLPEYAGAARLQALIAREREDTPDPLRRLAAILPSPPTRRRSAKRLKLSTQESLRLQRDAGTRASPATFAGGPRAGARLYRLGTRPLHRPPAACDGPGRLAGRPRAGAHLDAAGACRSAAPMRWRSASSPGRKVGALLDAVERWWIDGDFSADRAACLAELEATGAHGMIRPGLTFVLWLAIAVFVVLNDMVGDTWIGRTLSVRAVEWYKVLVPLPYVVMMALIHARRTAGPRWFEAALLAALLWPTSTVLVDFLYARFFYADDPAAFLDRFAFWWGAPYPLLIVGLFAFPIVAGALLARR